MVDIQNISFVVADNSVTIGAIYYLSTLWSTYRGRQASILSSLQSSNNATNVKLFKISFVDYY